jgi:hypothetical protein
MPSFGRAVLGEGAGELGTFGGRAGRPKARRLIGSFEPPADLNYGSTRFGDYTHAEVARILKTLHPNVPFVLRVEPGMKGIDVTVPKKSIDEVGFEHAEMKPLTESGKRTMMLQIQRWGLSSKKVRPITYDADGNVYYHFGF